MFVKIYQLSNLNESEPIRVDIENKSLMIVRIGNSILVTDSSCTHEEADLSLGVLSGAIIRCPLHGAKFDLRSGSVLEGPDGTDSGSIRNLMTYKVKVENDHVLVDI